MCKFKHCKGPEACFLKDISPCPGACQSNHPEPANIDGPHKRVRSRGFVDRDALARALMEDRAEASVQSVMRVQRVSNKLIRAVEIMSQRAH
ncbi:MAG: hypothetical protein AAF718_13720 [Pseudomonadota bacterium]